MTAKMDRQATQRTRPGVCRPAHWLGRRLEAFRGHVRGAMAIAMGFFMVLLMGMAVLALDVGRMMVVQVQMQHAADAAALAAAVELTGAPGAMVQAEAVARNAATQTSLYPLGAPVTLSVDTVEFFRNWTLGDPGSGDPATDDQNANVVRVVLNVQTLQLLLQPIVNILTGIANIGATTQTVHTAYAVAQQAAISCKQTPLMMCNPMEDPDIPCDFSAGNFFDPKHIGKMLIMKGGPGNKPDAPGEFNMLQTPDGSSAAGDLAEAMADSSGLGCTKPEVTTAPGSKTNQILWGVLTRFGTSPKYPNNPAPHVGTFPRDDNAAVVDLFMGNGQWNPDGYLLANTYDAGLAASPFATGQQTIPEGVDYPTRYQMYLWEIGVEFLVHENITIYPTVTPTEAESLTNIAAGGWTTVNGTGVVTTMSPGVAAPDVEIPTNVRGIENSSTLSISQTETSVYADTDEVAWVKRRNFGAAVLDCGCLGVKGSNEYPTYGQFIEMFVTEKPTQPGGSDSVVNMWAEYLGANLTGYGAQQDIVRNVQLIE